MGAWFTKVTGGNYGTNYTSEQIEEFLNAFTLFDKERTGCICEKELGNVLRVMGKNPTKTEIHDMACGVSVKRPGMIDFSEFVKMMARLPKIVPTSSEEMLRETFRIFDSEQKGYISANSLRRVMTTMGQKLSDEQIDEILHETPLMKDEKINFEEFVLILCT